MQGFKCDYQILKENFKFIWEHNEDKDNLLIGHENIESKDKPSWEEAFAKSYYDKLYKEYCIADLSLYKEGKYRNL